MLNLIIVGHKDHGKSTLIGRLLYDTNSLPSGKIEEIKKVCEQLGRKFEFAYLCDALEEERRKGMTIDTMQVFFRTRKRRYAIIDVPGHRELLKNMVTGACHADAAIIIVDAKEGIKEQTREHALILNLLGIKQVIVAINKMDMVSYKREAFEKIAEEMRKLVRKVGMKVFGYVPISAYKGDNVMHRSRRMGWYKGKTLVELLDSFREYERMNKPRFVVQGNYKGITMGNLLAGSLKEGRQLIVYPSMRKVKILKILNGKKNVKAPAALGLKLSRRVKRGSILGDESVKLTKRIKAFIFCLKGMRSGKYEIRCVTQRKKCKIKVLERVEPRKIKLKSASYLRRYDIGFIEIKMAAPLIYERFEDLPELGRFVIYKRNEIIAGGTIR